MMERLRGLGLECKNAQLLTVKKLGNADYGLADSTISLYWFDIGNYFKKRSGFIFIITFWMTGQR